MTMTRLHRAALTAALLAAPAAVVLGLLGPVPPARADQTCPPGQVEDVQTPGFQCVDACPPGTLLDAVTGSCIVARGVAPPALP
jgi:hypothetical protein